MSALERLRCTYVNTWHPLRVICAVFVLASITWTLGLVGVAFYEIADSIPEWLPAAFAGFAWSKFRRQSEAEAEHDPRLPIARVI